VKRTALGLNSRPLDKLQPRIQQGAGSSRFWLDLTTLQAFTDLMMKSGAFAPGFPEAVGNYYRRYDSQFRALTQEQFDHIKQDGRPPMMEAEDMDIYHCAQEYEYNESFISGMKLDSVAVSGSNARAVVKSSYEWKTDFRFKKVNGQWLISGYCLFV
jgi:hypothetical protein